MKLVRIISGLFVLYLLAGALTGCRNDPLAEVPADPEALAIVPPETLLGTIAFPDESAVVSLTFSNPRSIEARTLRPRTVYDITGSIRYSGVSFAVTGTIVIDPGTGDTVLDTADLMEYFGFF